MYELQFSIKVYLFEKFARATPSSPLVYGTREYFSRIFQRPWATSLTLKIRPHPSTSWALPWGLLFLLSWRRRQRPSWRQDSVSHHLRPHKLRGGHQGPCWKISIRRRYNFKVIFWRNLAIFKADSNLFLFGACLVKVRNIAIHQLPDRSG